MTLIACPDGRRLDVQVTGPEGGVPLFHHGRAGAVTPQRLMHHLSVFVGSTGLMLDEPAGAL